MNGMNVTYQPFIRVNLPWIIWRTLKKHFHNYAQNGGFPAMITATKPQELLKEYYNVMFYRDIVERHNISNIKLLEDYLALLTDQVS